jgi:hypothetical protein
MVLMVKLSTLLLLFAALPLQAQTWNPINFDKPVLTLSSVNAAVAFYDVEKTQACYPQHCYELDPLAKPIVNHPPLAYASAAGEWYGLSVLAQRMKHSRLKRIWWLPQATAIGLHIWAVRRIN